MGDEEEDNKMSKRGIEEERGKEEETSCRRADGRSKEKRILLFTIGLGAYLHVATTTRASSWCHFLSPRELALLPGNMISARIRRITDRGGVFMYGKINIRFGKNRVGSLPTTSSIDLRCGFSWIRRL